MKKVVAFLLALIIFVAPVTTLVKADVVIGDNDDTIINENATILGRKIALMESFSDLALSGVTEFTISNSNDVDSYLDSLWSELNDAIDSLSEGTGFTQISNDLKSKYFTNLVQYKDYINNRGDYFANLLQNPSTSLLSTFFANNIFGKHSTLHNNLSLDTFRALSRYNNNENPNPNPDFQFIQNVNTCLLNTSSAVYDFNSFTWAKSQYGSTYNFVNPPGSSTIYGSYLGDSHSSSGADTIYCSFLIPVVTINVDTSDPTNVIATYSSFGRGRIVPQESTGALYLRFAMNNGGYPVYYVTTDQYHAPQTTFSGLSSCINYIYANFANINLYVDEQPWILFNSALKPTLDIDGFLKIYGNDNPIQYELQPNTQIDYDQLYQVIYNAIRDNLPISQGDINYYDSHDTIYSPTIINNYGEEEGNESDLIDTILDYAVIPKFDTAIAQPMRQALTNGVVIMNTSITDVIPNEILLILGACFFLLLFAVVINRMIK